MSLKTKFQYVYTIGSVIILTALVSGVLLSIKGMNMLTNTLDSNEKAIDLYRAVVMERNTLNYILKMHRKYLLTRLMKLETIPKVF